MLDQGRGDAKYPNTQTLKGTIGGGYNGRRHRELDVEAAQLAVRRAQAHLEDHDQSRKRGSYPIGSEAYWDLQRKELAIAVDEASLHVRRAELELERAIVYEQAVNEKTEADKVANRRDPVGGLAAAGQAADPLQ